MKALAIDGRLAGETLGWHGALSMDEAAAWTASWYRAWRDGAEMRAVTLSQIARYTGLNG
jgi:CDP-glucose 4,6-dehydratase